jgi:hypothetical protein
MLHCPYCSANMNEIIDKILRSADPDAGFEAREKVKNYIGLLASAGKSPMELEAYGIAYLKEISKPDFRYSGW